MSADLDTDVDTRTSNGSHPTCAPELRIDESIGYTQETKVQVIGRLAIT